MTTALLLAAIAFARLSAASAQTPLQMTDTEIGPIRAGMPIVELQALGLPFNVRQVDQEGADFDQYTIRVRPDAIVTLIDIDGHADGVETRSAIFTTARGAHVGSTLEELIRLYPEGRVSIGIEGDAGHYLSFVLREGEPGGYFYFDPIGLPEICFHMSEPCAAARAQRARVYSAIYENPMTSLRTGAIGPLRLGMTRAEVEALRLPMRISGSAVVVTVAPDRDVTVTFQNGRASMLRTRSSGFQWYRGGSVGVTLEQLRSYFPSGQLVQRGPYLAFAVLPGHVFLFDTREPTDTCLFEDGAPCPAFSQTHAVEFTVTSN